MLAALLLSSLLSLSYAEPESLSNSCDRKCLRFSLPKTCYFKFKIESMDTGSSGCQNCIRTDGRRTQSIVVNGQLPGPSITVCYNDIIIVDVVNNLLEPADIHWHGIHQVETPWMDGTQYVTQYPIQPAETFRYKFAADMPGTFFYHSHFADQRALGTFGSLVIKRSHDNAENLYDIDTNVLFLNDWFYDGDIYKTHNILINGLGQQQNGSGKPMFTQISVKKGRRYRFRVIYSSSSNCTLDVSVDNHMLTVISSDSFPLEPVEVESFGITSGERFDFVINANKKVASYWIRVKGNYACGGMVQGAILKYEGSKEFPNVNGLNSFKELNGVQLNPTVNDRNEKDISIAKARSLEPWHPSSIYPTYYMNLTLRDKGMGNFDFFINEIYYDAETRFSLLQAKDIIPYSEYYCNSTTFEEEGTDCTQTTCKCAHLIDIPCRRFIEILFFNPTDDVHPMHFHGYDLRVVASGRLPPNVSNTDQVCGFF